MAGMINSFYYGKAGKADYTPDQMPKNRLALFMEVLRIRFSGLISMNLAFLVFLLPTIIATGMLLILFMNSIDAETGELMYNIVSDGFLSMYLIALIPCFALAGVGACGMMYVLRNWARDQHSFVWSDYKDAIKGNWKMGLLIGLIDGASLLITYVCWMYYGTMAETNVFFVVPQMMVIVLACIWWMMNMLMFPMLLTYDMKFTQVVKNALIMVVARLPWSVLFWGISLLVPILFVYATAFVTPYAGLVLLVIYGLCGFSVTGLMYASYANACFDRFLNPRIEGAQVNMGLRDPLYDALEDEADDEENNG